MWGKCLRAARNYEMLVPLSCHSSHQSLTALGEEDCNNFNILFIFKGKKVKREGGGVC